MYFIIKTFSMPVMMVTEKKSFNNNNTYMQCEEKCRKDEQGGVRIYCMTLREKEDNVNLKEKHLITHTLWRARFGRGYGIVARRTTKTNAIGRTSWIIFSIY